MCLWRICCGIIDILYRTRWRTSMKKIHWFWSKLRRKWHHWLAPLNTSLLKSNKSSPKKADRTIHSILTSPDFLAFMFFMEHTKSHATSTNDNWTEIKCIMMIGLVTACTDKENGQLSNNSDNHGYTGGKALWKHSEGALRYLHGTGM